METRVLSEASRPGWLADLESAAGVTSGDTLDVIQQRMDGLAMRAAPMARSWSRWMTLIQAMAVMMPTLWLIRRPLGLPPAAVAHASLAAVVCLIGALWWMRWRGMQRTWARARLVAEVARRQMTAAIFPVLPACRVLEAILDLKPIIETHDEARALIAKLRKQRPEEK